VETPRYSIQSDRPKHTQPASYLELNKGDMVLHGVFGKGMVLSVMKMGGDALLEIAFDDIGTKKLMAKTASVHMKKL
jgi:DNA helicase-2/ATP-dependent DNA helicase PcrA